MLPALGVVEKCGWRTARRCGAKTGRPIEETRLDESARRRDGCAEDGPLAVDHCVSGVHGAGDYGSKAFGVACQYYLLERPETFRDEGLHQLPHGSSRPDRAGHLSRVVHGSDLAVVNPAIVVGQR
jgi:hypothetical protein